MRKPIILLLGLLLVLPACSSSPKPEPGKAEKGKAEEGKNAEQKGGQGEQVASAGGTADLLKQLSSDDNAAQAQAATALAAQASADDRVIAALTTALTDDDAAVRARAATALTVLADKEDEAAIAALVKAGTDTDPVVRREAINALATIRPGPKVTLPLFIKVLEESDPSVVMPALHSLADRGEEAVPFLLEAMQSPKARYWALLVLADLGPKAKPAVELVATAASSDEPEVRMQALMTLGAIGKDAAPALDAIKKALGDETPAVQYAAIFALSQVGSEKDAGDLKDVQASEDPFIKTVAAWAVAMLDPAQREASIKLLVESLKSEDKQTRQFAARGLHELKLNPETEGPALIAVLQDEDPVVRANALEAIAALGEKIVPRVIEGLKKDDRKMLAAQVLGKMGPQAKSAVPALLEALSDDNPEFRCEVLYALGAIGPDAAAAADKIVKSLGDENQNVCVTTCYALGKIGPGAKVAVDQLKKQLDDKDPFRRLVSVWALLQIVPDDKDIQKLAVPRLIEGLGMQDRELARVEAAAALGDLGAVAKDALPALKKAAESDPSPAVRDAAGQAVKKISG